jgi:hypothetical protein
MNNLVPTRVNPDYYYNDKRINDELILNDDVDANNEDNNILSLEKKFIVKQRYIILSSLDRDWYNLDSSVTPFNYTAKLGMENDNEVNIFTSNTVKNVVSLAATKLLLPNKKLFVDYSLLQDSLSYKPYILIDINEGDYTNEGTNSTVNNAIAVMNSATPVSRTFCELNYLEYKNINGAVKNYYNNPVSNLSILNIQMKTQLNQFPFEINDVLSIDSIYSSGTNLNEKLNIRTSTFFSNQYQTGDIIKVKNYVYRDDGYNEANDFNSYINREKGHKIIDIKNSNYAYFTITQSGTTITQHNNGDTDFNDRSFASGDAGDTDKIVVYADGSTATVTHSSGTVLASSITKTITSPEKIYLKSATEVQHYNNILVISIPHTISTNTGTIVEESWWTSLKSKSSTEDDSAASGDSGGKLINTFLQSHLFLSIGYLDHENVVSSQLV